MEEKCPETKLSNPGIEDINFKTNDNIIETQVEEIISGSDAFIACQNLRKDPEQVVNLVSNSKVFSSSESEAEVTSSSLSSDVNKTNYVALNSGPMHNWQATKLTVRERFAFLFHNEILSDIYFIIGKDHTKERIPAHKFILSCGSAVFDAMFNGPLSTKVSEIELPDVDPPAFLALLRYMYSDDVQINPETVIQTLYVAKIYAVPAMEKNCVEFLERNLGSDHAFTLLSQARLFDEPKLAALCLETIDNNTAKALASDGFIDIDLDTLCAVLERDTIRISESELFKAVVEWGKAECVRQNKSQTPENLRTAIGKALKLIRFPLMSLEEFASHAAQSGILTDKEALQLFLYFTVKKFLKVNPKPSISFSDLPRCYRSDKEITVSRFHYVNSRWGYTGSSDRVGFVVDRKIFIVGFGLYGSAHAPAEYNVLMQLIHLPTGKVCGSNKTSFASDGTTFIFKVFFEEPIEVQPHTSYIAAVTLRGPDSHYGRNGVQTISLDIPGDGNGKVTFEFHAAGINNGTSVEEGQIPEIIFRV